jgi:glycosyltransferase involved in cell wall biosynthesis
MKKTLVLIPTYNEKDNIPILVTDLMAIPAYR